MAGTNRSAQKIQDYLIQIIETSIEKGETLPPWGKPWKTSGPMNLISKKGYKGMNWFTLMFSGLSPSIWVTFKQAKQLGGQVKPRPRDLDSKEFWGIPVYYYGTFTPKNEKEEEEPKRRKFLKHYFVFNAVHQCEGLDKHVEKVLETKDNEILTPCEMIVDKMPLPPPIKNSLDRAYYVPSQDSVHIPSLESFDSSEAYYSTLFHELIHSTGHPTRLDRGDIMSPKFGTDPYAKEELVAEFGASMLCAITGIENKTVDNSLAYLRGWLSKLQNETNLLIPAASSAQEAVDFIQGLKKSNNESLEESETITL